MFARAAALSTRVSLLLYYVVSTPYMTRHGHGIYRVPPSPVPRGRAGPGRPRAAAGSRHAARQASTTPYSQAHAQGAGVPDLDMV